jgi:hypothetical protein
MRRLASRPTLSTRVLRVVFVLGAAAMLAALADAPASAHAEKQVGRYSFVVGFGDEPAYGRKADPKFENAMMSLEPRFGDDWGTPGDYRSFFVPTQAGAYTFVLKGKLGDQKVDLVVPSGPETFGDVNDPAKAAFPAVKDPTTAQLAQRLDRESARLTASTAAATAAQRDAEQAASQARLLAFGGLLVGLVGLVVAALAWGRRTAAPAGRSEAALSGAGKV